MKYLYNQAGQFIGVYDGSDPPPNSTDQPPPIGTGCKPVFINGQWIDQAHPRVIPRISFSLRMTPGERTAIDNSTDPIVADWRKLFYSPDLQNIHLDLPDTRQALLHFVKMEIIKPERVDEILL